MHTHMGISVPCDTCVSLYSRMIGGQLYDIYRCTATNKMFFVPVGKPKE